MIRNKGKIVSFLSVKGGSGSTLLASNFSVYLASKLKEKTVLLDFEKNSTSVILSIDGSLALPETLEPEVFASLLPVHRSGLFSAVVDPSDSAAASSILKLLCASFENVVFDAGCYSKETASVLAVSSVIFLVVNPDVISLKTVAFVRTKLSALHVDEKRIRIVLNKTHPEMGMTNAVAEKIMGLPVSCEVPFELSAAAGVNLGKLGIDTGSKFAQALTGLAGIIEQVSVFAENNEVSTDINSLKTRYQVELLQRLTEMKIDTASFTDAAKKTELKEKVKEILEGLLASHKGETLSKKTKEELVKLILDDTLGLGPLEGLLADSSISEIMVNGKDSIYVERNGMLELTNLTFSSDKQLLSCIERIVAPIGRRIDESSPLVDARLPDGSRVNAIIPPLSLNGPALTIRKFSKERLTAEDLIRFGSFTLEAGAFLKACVLARKNIVISGGTGSGKTTLLNVISSFIPVDERIVTIEDSAELDLPQEHVLTLETRPPNIEGSGAVTIRDLVRNALRMRPDRIVVGECRGGEALDMLQAMNTGHDGSLTTLHSNSPRDTLSRLETMVLMAGMDLPLKAIRDQISSAVDIIIHQERLKGGKRRITHITEVAGMECDIIQTQDLFILSTEENKLTPSGVLPGFINDIALDREVLLSKT